MRPAGQAGRSMDGRLQSPRRSRQRAVQEMDGAPRVPVLTDTGPVWRRGRESNPRGFRLPTFEAGALDHYATHPRCTMEDTGPWADPAPPPCANAPQMA